MNPFKVGDRVRSEFVPHGLNGVVIATVDDLVIFDRGADYMPAHDRIKTREYRHLELIPQIKWERFMNVYTDGPTQYAFHTRRGGR